MHEKLFNDHASRTPRKGCDKNGSLALRGAEYFLRRRPSSLILFFRQRHGRVHEDSSLVNEEKSDIAMTISRLQAPNQPKRYCDLRIVDHCQHGVSTGCARLNNETCEKTQDVSISMGVVLPGQRDGIP